MSKKNSKDLSETNSLDPLEVEKMVKESRWHNFLFYLSSFGTPLFFLLLLWGFTGKFLKVLLRETPMEKYSLLFAFLFLVAVYFITKLAKKPK